MATRAAKANRDADVRQRLDAAAKHLADVLGVEMPPPAELVRDPELARIVEAERMAGLLEAVVARGGELTAERDELAKQNREYADGRKAVVAKLEAKAKANAEPGPEPTAARGGGQRTHQRPADRDRRGGGTAGGGRLAPDRTGDGGTGSGS